MSYKSELNFAADIQPTAQRELHHSTLECTDNEWWLLHTLLILLGDWLGESDRSPAWMMGVGWRMSCLVPRGVVKVISCGFWKGFGGTGGGAFDFLNTCEDDASGTSNFNSEGLLREEYEESEAIFLEALLCDGSRWKNVWGPTRNILERVIFCKGSGTKWVTQTGDILE